MAEAASSAAPTTAAPAAATDAAPSTAATPAPAKNDPAATLEKHVQEAIKAGEQAEAGEKSGGTQKPAAKPAKRGAKAAPKAPESKPEPAVAQPEEADEPEEKPEPTKAKRSPRQMLEAGDVDEAFEAAFGKKPGDFNINSKKWAEWRQATARIKQAHERKVQEDYSRLAAEESRVNGIIAQAKREVQAFMPFVKAKELYEAGDIEGAIKTAFGSDAADFNKRLIRAAHGKAPEDPRVAKLERELQEMRAERQRELQESQQQTQQREEQQRIQSNLEWIRDQLPNEDLEFDGASAASKPAFVNRVYEIVLEHYDPEANVTIPLREAAEMAAREWEENYGASFAPRGVPVSTTSVRGGSIPARPEVRASTTLSQKGAAEASAPKRGPDNLSLEDHVRMFTNLGKSNGARA